MEPSNLAAASAVKYSGLKDTGWVERTVPAELGTQNGQNPGKRKGIRDMPGLTKQMEAIHSKVQGLLTSHQQANEQGVIDQAQLDEWREAVAKWPISSLQQPLSFNRPSSWAPPGLMAKSRPSTTPEQKRKAVDKAPAPSTPPKPSDQTIAPVQDEQAVPRVDTSAIKVAWGATEGGRDHLGWVRHLIRFTETHPLFAPSSSHALPGVVNGGHEPELVIGPNGERGVKQQVFPAAHPSKREDVRLLAHWLTETLQHLEGNLPYGEATKCAEKAAEGDGEALANGALWVYSIAFDEFRRALATESRDRAELLAAMWDHCFALVQARTAMSYEGVVEAARHEVAARVDASEKAEQAAAQAMKGITQERDDLLAEADRKEATLKSLSQRVIKAERLADRAVKEKGIIEDALKSEVTQRMEAEAEVFRATRRAETHAAAASSAMQKIAVLEAKKADVVHCSVQQVIDTQDVQVDVDLITKEIEKAAAAEAKAKSELEEMKRDIDTNTILMMSLQEQLKERDTQIYQLQARAEAAEERSDSFENLAAEVKAELSRERTAHEATTIDLDETRESLAKVTAELTALREEASIAANIAADALADAEMRAQAADVARKDAQKKAAAAASTAQAAESAMVQLQEQLADAQFELQSVRELAKAQLQTLIKCGCSAAYTVEPEGACWHEYGEEAPLSVVMKLCNDHMEATYLRYVDSADRVRSLTEQLHDASLHRTELETALQDSKLERARAVREKEEAAIATSEVADEAEGLKLELEQQKKDEEDHLASIAALEAEIQARDEEIARLQTFVHKTQIMEVEAETLRVKIEMLEERCRALMEKGDAATERSQELQMQVKELSEKLKATEDLQEQKDALIEELRLIKKAKESLQESFDKISTQATNMQQQYKQVSVQLVQAQMTIKNFGEMHAADAVLVAQASEYTGSRHSRETGARQTSGPPSEASGSHHTRSSAPAYGPASCVSQFSHGPGPLGGSHPTSANPGTMPTTNSVGEFSRSDPSAGGHAPSGYSAPRSEAGSTTSSVASYLPGSCNPGAAPDADAAAGKAGHALHTSAQLASAQLKARLQQQRADAAESRERLLQRRLAEMEAAAAVGEKPSGAKDKRLDVLKDQVAQLEKHAANTAAELAAQQERADALIAHIARSPSEHPGPARSISSDTGTSVASGAVTSSQHYEPTLAPIPGSPNVPVSAQQGLTGTEPDQEGDGASPLQPVGDLTATTPRSDAGTTTQAITVDVQPYSSGRALRRTVSMVDDRSPGEMMSDIDHEIAHRVAASMRLKLGLLSWFCHNMRRRCVMEVVARLRAEEKSKAIEIELLEQASAREQQLLDELSELRVESAQWQQSIMSLLASFQPEVMEAHSTFAASRQHVLLLQSIAHAANQRWLCRVDKNTQSTHASVDAWMDLVRNLPADPPLETLMSHSALKSTIIRIYDLRMSDIMRSPNPQELVSRDSVFESIANYFNQQFAGDGEEVYTPELMEIDGPVARLLMSCRQYLKDPQVKLFAMFTGMVPEDYLGHEPWQFLLKVIFCVRLLMDVNWKLLIKAWPTERGAPFPVAAIMDLLANLYNAENPTELNITKTQVAHLIKQSRIGPAVDLDVLLMAIVHDHMKGECPRDAWVFPRRITDGRLPAISNVGGAALSSSSVSATGQFGSSRSGSSSSRPTSRISRPLSRISVAPTDAPSQLSLRGQIDVYSVLENLNDTTRSNTPTTPPHNLPGTPGTPPP